MLISQERAAEILMAARHKAGWKPTWPTQIQASCTPEEYAHLLEVSKQVEPPVVSYTLMKLAGEIS